MKKRSVKKQHTFRRLLRPVFSGALICALAFGSLGCGAEAKERELFAMDTFMRIKAYGANAEKGLDGAQEVITRLSDLLSVTDERSEIYAVNYSGGSPVCVSPETFDIISRALEFSSEAGEAFELTIRPVSRAWGFTGEEYRIPEGSEIESLLRLVDDGQILLDESAHTVTLPEGFEIDLGGAAKGCAADMAKEAMTEAGVEAALIDLGSSTILAYGQKPDGSSWKIAVKDPKGGSEPAGVIEFDGGAVSTSGGYERYFEGPDGQVYWHIMDPASGAPARSGVLSVTVLTESAFYGDGLSTALFVMGPEKAAEYYTAHNDFEYLMFLEDGSVLISPGMEKAFTPKK